MAQITLKHFMDDAFAKLAAEGHAAGSDAHMALAAVEDTLKQVYGEVGHGTLGDKGAIMLEETAMIPYVDTFLANLKTHENTSKTYLTGLKDLAAQARIDGKPVKDTLKTLLKKNEAILTDQLLPLAHKSGKDIPSLVEPLGAELTYYGYHKTKVIETLESTKATLETAAEKAVEAIKEAEKAAEKTGGSGKKWLIGAGIVAAVGMGVAAFSRKKESQPAQEAGVTR